jgi:hypothetical protein
MLITHRIADITFRTESDVLIPHLLENHFERFRTDDGKPLVRQRIRQLNLDSLTLPPLDSRERERIVRCVGFPQRWLDSAVFRSPEVRAVLRRCLDRPELVHIELAWNRAVIRNFARNEFDLFYPPEKRQDLVDPLFVAGFRNMIDAFLPNFSAVMVHGAGVVRNSIAPVFLAPDEGGKTSLVRQSTGVSILNDDHVILRKSNSIVMVHGTPLGLITSGPHRARLGGFFLLEKASQFDLIPIKAWDVLQFLWNECAHKWHALPKSTRLQAFEILYGACRQAPTYRMRFPKDYVDWDAIDAAMVG